jgi:hypothetical protein
MKVTITSIDMNSDGVTIWIDGEQPITINTDKNGNAVTLWQDGNVLWDKQNDPE